MCKLRCLGLQTPLKLEGLSQTLFMVDKVPKLKSKWKLNLLLITKKISPHFCKVFKNTHLPNKINPQICVTSKLPF